MTFTKEDQAVGLEESLSEEPIVVLGAAPQQEKSLIIGDDDDGNNTRSESHVQMEYFQVDGTKREGFSYQERGFEDEYHNLPDNSPWSRHLSRSWYEWIYPPNIPRSVQLFRKENIAIPACYLIVGLLQGLSGPFMNVYPLEIGASEAQQTTIYSLRSLPASLKLLFGFWSDNVPLFGYRRKSYMFLGWLLTSLSMLALLTGSDLGMEEVPVESYNDGTYYEEDGNSSSNTQTVRQPAAGAPSISFLSICTLLFGMGFWFADVMGDSLVAEKSKLEPESSRGHLQSTCYACRFFGLMVASPLSTVLYSVVGPASVVFLMATLPVVMLPFIYHLHESRFAPVRSTQDQCTEIWTAVCSRAVWQPMGFVYLYGVLQVGNAAWREFSKSVLGFSSEQMNSLLVVAHVLLYLGILSYKYYFIRWSWRTVYIFTTLLNGIFSSLQVLLIQGITFGLSPFFFALGDDAFADFVGGIQFLPTTIMMVHLCPTGSEGASYAMFTTVHNAAYTLSSAISTQMLGIFDVSKDTLIDGDLSGMTRLTILTTAIQVSGVLFVKLLPHSKEDLTILHQNGSKMGGFIFLSITFLSILYALVICVLNIVKGGES